jgi:3-oxoacyl-[acyl-carrier protein] reductase
VHAASSVPTPERFEQTKWSDFSTEFDTQVGTFHSLLSSLINGEQAGEGLSVIVISTIYAHNIPPPMLSCYVAVKSSLNGLVKALAVEYGPRGFRFNTVSPGMTESKMLLNVTEKARLVAKMNTPLRRLGQPQDIIPLVEFLLSESSSHITGQNIAIAGGLSV